MSFKALGRRTPTFDEIDDVVAGLAEAWSHPYGAAHTVPVWQRSNHESVVAKRYREARQIQQAHQKLPKLLLPEPVIEPVNVKRKVQHPVFNHLWVDVPPEAFETLENWIAWLKDPEVFHV